MSNDSLGETGPRTSGPGGSGLQREVAATGRTYRRRMTSSPATAATAPLTAAPADRPVDRPPVAVVTGASRGLGRALLSGLVDAGWSVAVDARNAEDLHAAVAALPPGARVRAVPGDITDRTHRQALLDAADELGGLDLLVNNAGVLGPSPQPALADHPLDALRRVLEVYVVAPLALVQLALPRLRPGARIVSITSDAAVEAYPGWGGYGAAKAALEQLTAVLAAEHPDLRVYTADPGDMRTRMHQEAFPGEDISDRPDPAERVPALLRLTVEDLPSGRYTAEGLAAALTAAGRR